jgi:hypothetical protein
MTKSPIPADIERLLSDVARNLDRGESARLEVSALIAALSALPANTVSRAASHIALNTRLFVRHDRPSLFQRILRQAPIDQRDAMRIPGMEYLFLFHQDGAIEGNCSSQYTWRA